MIKKIRKNWRMAGILVAIFVVALLLRTVNLSKVPAGFQIDESSLGYNAFSLLNTGRDESGAVFPLYVSTFGDYNPIGYDYIDIIPVALLGLSEFSTRLPAAVFGALSVFAIFYLAQVLFKNKKISLISAGLLALSPWHIELSRGSAETLVALFFVIFGFGFVISFFETHKVRNLVSGTLFLLTSFFIYPAPRIFVPLFLLVLIIFYFKTLRHNVKSLSLILGSFIFLVVSIALLIFAIPGGTARFQQTSIFNFPETKLLMDEQIREDGVMHTRNLVTRGFHNKPINFSLTFAAKYMEYFSGSYLFIKGGLPILFIVPAMGLVYIVELPFILWGIYVLIRTKGKTSKLPLLWLLCAPVVAALTVDDSPNVRRSLLMVPALELIAAVGMYECIKKVQNVRFKYMILSFVVLFFVFNVLYFCHQYFVHSQTHRTWYRNNGFSQMMKIVSKNYKKYDKIVMTKNQGGYPLVLFYSQYDPKTYQDEGSPKDVDYKGFGKYIFVPNDCPSINSSVDLPVGTKVLYVDGGTCKMPSKKSGRKYTEVLREDGSLGFRIVY